MRGRALFAVVAAASVALPVVDPLRLGDPQNRIRFLVHRDPIGWAYSRARRERVDIAVAVFEILIRLSDPVRHLTSPRKARAGSRILRAGDFVGPAGNRHGLDAQVLQIMLDGCLAVAAAGGNRAEHAACPTGDPLNGRCELWTIRSGAVSHAVVQDAVVVTDDLGLVPELHRPVDAPLADRPRIRARPRRQQGSKRSGAERLDRGCAKL
jgi:hypothetical protein